MKSNSGKISTAMVRKSRTTRRVANPGVAKLRKDADDKILEHSGKIAKALAEGAENGNASSARLLVDLAENANWTEHTDAVSTVISLATDWVKQIANPAPSQPTNVELQVTTNPPRVPKPEPSQRQLTDGQNDVEDAEIVDGEPES